MAEYLMGIDIGTSACKAALFSLTGTVVGAASAGYRVEYPEPGFAQQDPGDWWAAVCACVRRCLAQSGVAAGQVAAVGVDGQSWSCIPVDTGGTVLAPTPIWTDSRAAPLCGQVEARLGGRLRAVSGNPFKASYTTPKMLWFKRQMPELYKNTAFFLQSNGYIVYRLTGVFCQDRSQGYGLHFYNMAQGEYDLPLARELGLDPEKVPPLADCWQLAGRVTSAAAAATGLRAGTPVAAGGLDAACSALGAGVIEPGQAQEQGGQAGGMSLCTGVPLPHPDLILSAHVAPGRWLLQGGTVAGGAALRWLAGELGGPEQARADQTGQSAFALLDELAAQALPGAGGVVFLPYLSGERSPLWDPAACGVFFGLRFGTTRAHLFRAVLEGVAYALRHNLETARGAGIEAQTLYATGGAANSPLWMQIKADVTGTPVRAACADTAAALGAAMLAGVGVGCYPDLQAAVRLCARPGQIYRPRPGAQAVYEAYYPIYRQLYEDLKDTMGRAARIERSEKV
ncbi:xylulokinase [Allofournierella sp.]|uniref:xylulokinase n=1 Tax=Allofournierella sp. TaxID=1940256 RepID=UPI003AB2B491